jgi:hypothetical protein
MASSSAQRGSASPWQTRCGGRCMLLIELLLERGFDFTDLFSTEVILDPADHDLFGQIGVGDHVAGFGLLQPYAAIRAAAVRAIVQR